MSTVIDSMYEALERKAQLFKEELELIVVEPFYTKFQSKTRHRQNEKQNSSRSKEPALRAYALWSDFEDMQLRVGYTKDKLTIKKLSQKHQRTKSAIESRLRKLRLIVF
jgi:hypothetical protein